MLLLAPFAGDDVTEGAGPTTPDAPIGTPEPPRVWLLVFVEGVVLFWGAPLGEEDEARRLADCWGVRVLVLVLLVIDNFLTASVEQEEK